jgi:uncharacterized membrane protein YphA (DoxX/SURF4 family)
MVTEVQTAKPVPLPLVSLLLKVGIAISFLYAAIASFAEPDAWIGYFPAVLQKAVPANLLLTGFSVVEIILSLWLLSGKKLLYSAVLASLMLAGIIFFNFGAMDIVFRDFGILFAALALAVIGYNTKT